jgi:hypothetical protein
MADLMLNLRTAAASFAGLTALLGTSPFRWWDTQLVQGSALPAVVTQLVAGSKTYTFAGRLPTGFSRVQFTIWADNPVSAANVEAQLTAFLDQFAGNGISGLVQYPNSIVMQRQSVFQETQPPKYQRITDAQIFSNDLI